LLEDEALADRLAHAGRERVRREFLTPRLLRDDIALYRKLLAAPQPQAEDSAAIAVGAR